MPGVEWRLTQSHGLSQQFRRAREKLQDPVPAWNRMLDEIAAAQEDWFDREGAGARYKPWQELSPRYARWKRRQPNGDQGILVGPDLKPSKQHPDGHTGGQLRAELTRRAHGGSRFGYETKNRDGFTFGTNLPYAVYHKEGRGRLPVRRPIRPIDKAMLRKFEGILMDHLEVERAAFTARGWRAPSGNQRAQPRRSSRSGRRGRR